MILDASKLVVIGCLAFAGCESSINTGRPQRAENEQGEVRLVVTVDRSVARIAEPCHVTVEVFAPASKRLPAIEFDNRTGDVAIVDVAEPEVNTADGRTVHVQHFMFECYKSGAHSIPAVLVKVPDLQASASKDAQVLIRSEPIPLRVLSSISLFDDPRRFYDDVDVIDPPRGTAFQAFVAGFILVALTLLVLWLRPQLGALAPTRSPFKQALHQLGTLEERLQRRQIGSKEAIVAGELVLRQFLLQHWRLTAAQLTETELAWISAWPHRLDDSSRAALRSLLELASAVKFGEFEATPQMTARFLIASRMIVIASISSPGEAKHREAVAHV